MCPFPFRAHESLFQNLCAIMEAFQLLTRGGSFNKNRFRNDVQLFAPKPHVRQSATAASSSPLPKELDFFKYATQRPHPESDAQPPAKRRKIQPETHDDDSDDEQPESDDDEDENIPLKHRVKITGSNVPDPVTTFKALNHRYSLPGHLFSNIQSYGFDSPTEIQAYGIPVLLNVRLPSLFSILVLPV
jgi:ATP-dependent RNA helicase DDX52/ROK1